MEEVVRRLGITMHLNPYTMWREQTPRQILELLQSYREMNDDSEDVNRTPGKTVKSKSGRKVEIPDWYTVPEGATVYHADDVCQEDV